MDEKMEKKNKRRSLRVILNLHTKSKSMSGIDTNVMSRSSETLSKTHPINEGEENKEEKEKKKKSNEKKKLFLKKKSEPKMLKKGSLDHEKMENLDSPFPLIPFHDISKSQKLTTNKEIEKEPLSNKNNSLITSQPSVVLYSEKEDEDVFITKMNHTHGNSSNTPSIFDGGKLSKMMGGGSPLKLGTSPTKKKDITPPTKKAIINVDTSLDLLSQNIRFPFLKSGDLWGDMDMEEGKELKYVNLRCMSSVVASDPSFHSFDYGNFLSLLSKESKKKFCALRNGVQAYVSHKDVEFVSFNPPDYSEFIKVNIFLIL